MKRYFAGIGTIRNIQKNTWRLIDTVEETTTTYHELWACDLYEMGVMYQIRSIKMLPDTKVEWTERDFSSLDMALDAFNKLEEKVS